MPGHDVLFRAAVTAAVPDELLLPGRGTVSAGKVKNRQATESFAGQVLSTGPETDRLLFSHDVTLQPGLPVIRAGAC